MGPYSLALCVTGNLQKPPAVQGQPDLPRGLSFLQGQAHLQPNREETPGHLQCRSGGYLKGQLFSKANTDKLSVDNTSVIVRTGDSLHASKHNKTSAPVPVNLSVTTINNSLIWLIFAMASFVFRIFYTVTTLDASSKRGIFVMFVVFSCHVRIFCNLASALLYVNNWL